jgi:hypothetical protein
MRPVEPEALRVEIGDDRAQMPRESGSTRLQGDVGGEAGPLGQQACAQGAAQRRLQAGGGGQDELNLRIERWS